MRVFAAVFTSVVLLAGCGKELSPMDSAQKDRYRASLAQLASVSNALQEHTGLGRANELVSAIGDTASNMTGTETNVLKAELARAVQAGECSVKNNAAQAVGSSSFQGPLVVEILGDRCPIAFRLQVDGKADKTDMKLNFDIDYSVKSDSFRKLCDVDGIDLNGTFEATAGKTSMNLKLDADGKLHSAAEKDLGFYLNASVGIEQKDQDNADVTVDTKLGTKFKDFTGELRAKGTAPTHGKPKIQFFLNDKEIEETEYKSYLGDFKGLSFQKLVGG